MQLGGTVIRLGFEAGFPGNPVPLENVLAQIASLGFLVVLDFEAHDGFDGVVGAAFDSLQERGSEVDVPHLIDVLKVPFVSSRLPLLLSGPPGRWAEVPPVVAVAV